MSEAKKARESKGPVSGTAIEIVPTARGHITMFIRGRTPLICNAMSAKTKKDLLFPPPKKTTAQKQQTLKHEPITEYRASVYKHRGEDRPTRIYIPTTAFKRALMTAALDLPGAKKAQIGRLVWVDGDKTDIYGAPKMLMSVVRMADMKRTPDIRTRAILPEWGCVLQLYFASPALGEQALATLAAAAGDFSGVGDMRQEKGAGNYGQFDLVEAEDLKEIMSKGGRDAQDAALLEPEYYDDETEELYFAYDEAVKRLGDRAVAMRSTARRPSVS